MILFEGYPDFTDNTYPVYLELKKRLPGYKMVWVIHGDTPGRDGILCVRKKKTIPGAIKFCYWTARSRAIICCNKYIMKFKRGQLSLFLAHGSAVKDVTGVYDLEKFRVDFVSVQSHFFDQASLASMNATPDKLIHLGFPRCDWFYRPSRRKDIDSIVKGKYIVWLPTFRNSRKKLEDAPGSVFYKTGVPLFYTADELREFDSFLRSRDIHILYKPHFVQDMDIVRKTTLPNFIMIGDNDILSRDIQLYELLAQSEALITDYSSVFWDYMLLDRPIAVTTDDIKEYKVRPGFMCDFEAISAEAAETINTQEGMRGFITSVAEGIDTKREGRRKWRDITNMHQDGGSSGRVADFVADWLGMNGG